MKNLNRNFRKQYKIKTVHEGKPALGVGEP